MEHAATFSVSPDYYRAAVAELRDALPVATVRRLGEDAGLIELRREPGTASERAPTLARVADACRSGQVRFVRHLAAADEQVRTSTLAGGPDVVADWALEAVLDRIEPGDEVSLHVWDSGRTPYAPGKIRRPILEALMDAGARVVPGGATRTVSVCVGEERSTVGLGDSDDGLSDWAGGRMRLASRPEQISRAEFKLEELFSLIGDPAGDTAIDLGASPGGWTRILHTRGFSTIHAVDPADLDERVLRLPGVTHHRTTAGEFIYDTDQPVDLIVNDMRMVPHLTASTMADAARLLSPGGRAIITFKLGTSNPVKQADESLQLLGPSYEPIFIRQLQHNRQELTVVADRI